MGGVTQIETPGVDAEPAVIEAVSITEAGYLILLSLAGGAAHGYRIMQVINDVFRTELRMGPGTLYRTLQRLTADGLIEEALDAGGEEDGDVERRRAYRLTERGLATARKEMRRLEVLVRLAKAQLPGAR
jgi:DNA-binding PadR family transcriptional regulator